MKKIVMLLLILAVLGGVGYLYFYKSPEQKQFEAAKLAADRGDVAAQKKLAQMYLTGTGAKTNADLAVDLYTKAAASGDAGAAYTLAELYINGTNVPQDFSAAVTYLKIAAANADARAQYELGRFYKEGLAELPSNAGHAAFWWMQAMQSGSPEAEAALQDMQLETPELYAKVKELFDAHQKAQKGSAEDQFFLAESYRSGVVLEKDMEAALYWYEKAQSGNIAQAWYELGLLYEKGNGVSVDKAKALELYTKAADAGYVPAEYELGREAYSQASTQQTPDYTVAFGWLKRAAGAGNSDAQYMLGILYMQGHGTEQSVPLAVDSFRKAAEQGNSAAQYVLGQSYYKGLGVKQNLETSKKWLRLSADNGNESAKQFLEQIK